MYAFTLTSVYRLFIATFSFIRKLVMKGNFVTVITLQLGITGAGYANPSQIKP